MMRTSLCFCCVDTLKNIYVSFFGAIRCYRIKILSVTKTTSHYSKFKITILINCITFPYVLFQYVVLLCYRIRSNSIAYGYYVLSTHIPTYKYICGHMRITNVSTDGFPFFMLCAVSTFTYIVGI